MRRIAVTRFGFSAAAVALVAVAAMLGGCTPTGPTAKPIDYTLHVENGTALALTIVVNGQPITETAARGNSAIPTTALPPLPWTVDARTVSGRIVLTLAVAAGSIVDTDNADGSHGHSAPGARVDLSCGRLDIYPGSSPMLGPMPGAGVPGDCVP